MTSYRKGFMGTGAQRCMEAVTFKILCSLNEGACQRLEGLVKEPYRITKQPEFNRYEVYGEFESLNAAQIWAGGLYMKAGTDIAGFEMVPMRKNWAA